MDRLAESGPECPPLEEWGMYVEGLCSQDRNSDMLNHAAECAACGGLLADLTGVSEPEDASFPPLALKSGTPQWKREMAVLMESRSKRPARPDTVWRRRILRPAAVAAALVFAVWTSTSSFSVSWLLARSANRIHDFRIAEMPFRPLNKTLGGAGAKRFGFRVAELLIAARTDTGIAGAAWQGLQGRALLLDDPDDKEIDDAVAVLGAAHAAAPSDAGIANDLAVALLVRSSRNTSSSRADLQRAVEVLSGPQSARDAASLFNLAWAWQLQKNDDQELDAWQRFLEVEPESGWAEEARQRIRALGGRARMRFLRPLRPEDAITEFARNGFESFGTVQPGAVARAMEQKGDAWLAQFLALAGQPASRRAVAELQSAARALDEGRIPEAVELARSAALQFTAGGNRPGADFALYELAYALQRAIRASECIALVEDVHPAIAARGYLWLDIQLRLTLASCLGAVRKFRNAFEQADAARELAKEAGYASLEVHAMGMQSGALREVGSYREALAWDSRSLERIWNGEGGSRRNAYQAHYASAVALQNMGYPRAAAASMKQALRLAAFLPDRRTEALARSRYAEILGDAGETEEAYRQLLEVEEFFALRPDGEAGLRSYALLPRARLDRIGGDPEKIRRAIETVAEVEAFLQTRPNVAMETQMWHVKAELLTSAKEFAQSVAALRELLRLGEAARDSLPADADRSATARRVAEGAALLVDAYLADGRIDDAWKTWIDFNPSFLSAPRTPSTAQAVYAVLPSGPTVLVSTARGIAHRRLAGADDLQLLMTELRALAATRDSSLQRLMEVSRRLGAVLVDPLQAHLHGIDTLYIAAAEPLAGIPFAALTLPDGRWLGEVFRISYSPPLTGAGVRSDGAITPELKLLAASYGGFNTILGHVLPALGADIARPGEAAALAFSSHTILDDEDATPANVLRNLPGAEVFQFSGHAITAAADAALVLKPKAEASSALLWASALTPSALRNLRLAVLAACSTGRAPGPHHYPGSDMARAFLQNGVPSVLASGWDVDADATSQLIQDFFASLNSRQDLETALFEAASRLRNRKEFAHPYYWAAFALFRR